MTTSRRGGHTPSRAAPTPVEPTPVAKSPAMHVTPNVVIAARGTVATNFSDASQSRALDMRNLRS
ncbi:MAG: hypothetical protein H0U80_02540 [Solirubrobacterales bacterium]|nr:hypothetical protein [Solirubrobacterales bacterium]